jgi:predicted metal-dependent peptidase
MFSFGSSYDLTVEEKIISAKIKLLMDQPFFGNIASRLEPVASTKYPLGATDGQNIYYNPEAIAKMPISEIVFFYAHEVLHVVFQHFMRMDNRNIQIWNFATDYAVNAILKKNKVGTQIKHTLYEKKYDGPSSEEIYEDLSKNIQTLDLNELAKMLLDSHLDGNFDADGKPRSQQEIDRISNEIKKAIIDAAQTSKDAGNVPMGLERLINKIVNPQLPWQELLRQSIQSKKKSDFSFMRPNKRNSLGNIIFPSIINENEINICIAMDMSGSIGQEVADKFMSEINGIINEFNSWKIKVWCFDTEVYEIKDFSSDEDDDILSYKPKGGGGTDFNCNWNFMKKEDIVPELFIMFTDMYPYNGWGDENYCDTLFVGYNSNNVTAPFGETIFIK